MITSIENSTNQIREMNKSLEMYVIEKYCWFWVNLFIFLYSRVLKDKEAVLRLAKTLVWWLSYSCLCTRNHQGNNSNSFPVLSIITKKHKIYFMHHAQNKVIWLLLCLLLWSIKITKLFSNNIIIPIYCIFKNKQNTFLFIENNETT